MANCLDTLLLTSGGTSQAQRPLDALLAQCPQVDERTMADLILFTKKYGAYLNFYDLTNSVNGDWQQLMGSDSAVIIATIADWKTQDYAPFIKTISDNAINAPTGAAAKNYFKVLFDFAFSLAEGLNDAYNQLPPDSAYAQFLSVTIASSLATPLNALIYYYNQFKSNTPDALIDGTSTFTYPATPVDPLIFSQNLNIPIPALTTFPTPPNPLIPPFSIDPNYQTNNILLSGVLRNDINHILTHNLFVGVYQSFIDGVTNIVGRTQAFLVNIVDSDPSHQPHYALYLTFLQLFAYAQQHLNQYTKRHLDFYYKDVLALTNNAAEADFVHLVFALQKNIIQHLIPAGTNFKAGKDAKNNDLFYATTNDVVLQTASVALLRSIFLNKNINPVTLFSAPVANSADGQGAKLLSAYNSWFPFSDPQQNVTTAPLGFALATSVLYLNEGTRTITLTFNCSSLNGIAAADLSNIFTIQLTGAKSWYTATGYTVTTDGNSFTLTILLPGDAPAIVPYSAKIHAGNFTVALPMVQVMLSSYASYQKIKLARVTSVIVSATVDAVKNLMLQNDDGKIDTSKPFKLFGDFPDQGASFIIGSKETFQKSLTSLTINFDWQQEPLVTSTVNMAALAKGDWQPINSNTISLYASSITLDSPVQSISGMFSSIKNASLQFIPEMKMTPKFEVVMPSAITPELMTLKESDSSAIAAAAEFFSLAAVKTTGLQNIVKSPADFTANAAYTITSVDGFIELELNGIDYTLSTFLNKIIPPSVTVNYDNSTPPKVSGYTVNKVTTPVAAPPAIKSISITYSAEDTLVFTNTPTGFNTRSNFYYHIEPFGYREMHPFLTNDALTFLPVFNLDDGKMPVVNAGGSTNENGGELWIGLSNALADETFSVLFEVSDGSANPLESMTEVDWYYLSANNWIPFSAQSVTDQTNNLTTSGLVIFNVPAAATLNNTRADNNLIWIKAVVDHATDAVCNLIAVDANATKAQFVQVPANNIAFTNPIPPNTISKPAVPDGALKQTQQPYNSFGGRIAETDDQFYVRVSERLRHKHRAITAWDYERLTLQYFPQIFKVKCLNHTGFITDEKTGQPRYAETLAGQVMVITIPDLTQLNTANILRPYTSIGLLTEIQLYLQTLTSPFVKLNLCNPQFEEVQFDFSVTFKENFDPTFFTNQLNSDIEQFLTPWAYGNPQAIDFGTTIQKSVVLNFVEESYYVDFVTCFKMNQIIRDGSIIQQAFYDIEEAMPSTARSILVSYYDAATNTKHLISTPANCDC